MAPSPEGPAIITFSMSGKLGIRDISHIGVRFSNAVKDIEAQKHRASKQAI